MTPSEFRAAIAELGWSQLEAGRRLGVADRTARRFASDSGPSGPAALALRLLLAAHRGGLSWSEADRLTGGP